MASIEQRLEWLKQETVIWANGGWRSKKDILEEGKKILAREKRKCLVCFNELDGYCKYEKCKSCRDKEWEAMRGA